MSSDISTDKATFSYAIEQKDDNEKNYYIYAAVTENDEIALGFRYDIRSKGAGFNIITVGSFWILLPEAGNIAATNFSEGFSTAYIGKTMNSVQNGQGSFDITKYTETMSMDMPVKQWTKDVNDQETTEDKKLSEAKNKTWMSGASKTPVSAESLFTESGVTLSDLGFTLLNTDSSADINDQ